MPVSEDWRRFIEYNRWDVELERQVGAKLARFPLPEDEWRLWHLDQRINARGLPIDRALVTAARRALATLTGEPRQ